MNGAKLFSAVLCLCGSTLKLIITFEAVVDLIWKSLRCNYCQYYIRIWLSVVILEQQITRTPLCMVTSVIF